MIAIGLALVPAAAHAGLKAGGVDFPDTYPVGDQELRINGAAVRVFFGFIDGYATALYLASPAHSADAIIDGPDPKVVYTEFLHAASAAQGRDEFRAVHERYCADVRCGPDEEAAYKQFLSFVAPVTRGGTQAFVITASGVQVFRDNRPVGDIAIPSFGKALLRSLVGPASPTPGYRRGLIGAPAT